MKNFDFGSVRWGFFLALMGIMMGVYLGIHFGKDEGNIKSYLKEKAVSASFYKGDEKLIEEGVSKAWKYLKRSHEHFQGIGAISIGLILLLSASWLKPVLKTVISIGMGVGSFVYPLFWYLVAFRTADMGGHAAKESLGLIAQFGAGVFALSFLAVFLTILCYAIWKDDLPAFLERLKS